MMVASSSIASRDWNGLPLFPDLTPNRVVFRSNDKEPFADSFLNELATSRPIQRLKNIGFLGAIDYAIDGNGNQAHRRRHNRYDHSIGVAQLAGHYAKIRELSFSDTRLIMAAGLLHDVGHGPLSHTLEPVFKSQFGITHHKLGEQIINGESSYKFEIASIFSNYRVDIDEMNAYLDFSHEGEHSYLFSGPINLDTIEGITRSRSFFAKSNAFLPALEIVESIARSESLPTKTLDLFWNLKHEVYNVFIHHNMGLIYDGLAQAYMLSEIEKFNPKDFLKTEKSLRNKYPELFYIFSWAQKSRLRLLYRIQDDLLDHEISAPERSFNIDYNVNLDKVSKLNLRYLQKKIVRKKVIRNLIQSEGYTI